MPLARHRTDTVSVSRFRFRTVAEARDLARRLSADCPKPSAAETGLFELFINAIEHGNLEIGAADKGLLLAEDRLLEEIERRLQSDPYKKRQVEVDVAVTQGTRTFTVTDEGPGFNWRIYLKSDDSNLTRPHGRGILIAKKIAFDTLEYSPAGNMVKASIFLT